MKTLFIGGCPRSGTTFLAERLGAILGGEVTPESQFKIKIIEYLRTGERAAVTRELASDFKYALWSRKPDIEFMASIESPAEFFSNLVFPDDKMKREEGIWIDHTPDNLNYFSLLSSVFPSAKFINIIRDGRAVFSSVSRLPWGPSNPIHAAKWWMERSSPGLAISYMHPGRCITVTYEKLVRADMAEWKRLIAFSSGVDSESLGEIDIDVKSNFAVPDYTVAQHKLVGQRANLGRLNAWKKELAPRDIEIFEANAGGLLDAFDYQRVSRWPSHASRIDKLKMFEWPILVRVSLINRLKARLRKRKYRQQLP